MAMNSAFQAGPDQLANPVPGQKDKGATPEVPPMPKQQESPSRPGMTGGELTGNILSSVLNPLPIQKAYDLFKGFQAQQTTAAPSPSAGLPEGVSLSDWGNMSLEELASKLPPETLTYGGMSFRKLDGDWQVYNAENKWMSTKDPKAKYVREFLKNSYDNLASVPIAAATLPASFIPGTGGLARTARTAGQALGGAVGGKTGDEFVDLTIGQPKGQMLREITGAEELGLAAGVIAGGASLALESAGPLTAAYDRFRGKSIPKTKDLVGSPQSAEALAGAVQSPVTVGGSTPLELEQTAERMGVNLTPGQKLAGIPEAETIIQREAQAFAGNTEAATALAAHHRNNLAQTEKALENVKQTIAPGVNTAEKLAIENVDPRTGKTFVDGVIEGKQRRLRELRQVRSEAVQVAPRKPRISGTQMLAIVEESLSDAFPNLSKNGQFDIQAFSNFMSSGTPEANKFKSVWNNYVNLRNQVNSGPAALGAPMRRGTMVEEIGAPVEYASSASSSRVPETPITMGQPAPSGDVLSEQLGMTFPGNVGQKPLVQRNPVTGKIERIPGNAGRPPTVGEPSSVPSSKSEVVSSSRGSATQTSMKTEKFEDLYELPKELRRDTYPNGMPPEIEKQRSEFIRRETAARAFLDGPGGASERVFTIDDLAQWADEFQYAADNLGAYAKQHGSFTREAGTAARAAGGLTAMEAEITEQIFKAAGMPTAAIETQLAKREYSTAVESWQKFSQAVNKNIDSISKVVFDTPVEEFKLVNAGILNNDTRAQLAAKAFDTIREGILARSPGMLATPTALDKAVAAEFQRTLGNPTASQNLKLLMGDEAFARMKEIANVAARMTNVPPNASATMQMGWISSALSKLTSHKLSPSESASLLKMAKSLFTRFGHDEVNALTRERISQMLVHLEAQAAKKAGGKGALKVSRPGFAVGVQQGVQSAREARANSLY